MKKQIKNGILRLQLQWNCYLLIKAKRRYIYLNQKIDQIENSFQ